MNIVLKIGIIALIYLILSSILSAQRTEYLLLMRLCTVIIIFFLIAEDLSQLLSSFLATFSIFNIKSEHINLLIRVSGIAVITEFVCNTLIDSGEKSLSYIISLSSKVLIIYQSLPIINELIIFSLEILE